jgi:hypothetical protein
VVKIRYVHIVLAYHTLNRRTDRRRLDCVDRAPSQAEKTITSALDELSGDLVGDLDSLILNCETADGDDVSTDSTTCRRLVSVRDLPSAALRVLPSAALGWVKDGMSSLSALRLNALIEIGRPDPDRLASLA